MGHTIYIYAYARHQHERAVGLDIVCARDAGKQAMMMASLAA